MLKDAAPVALDLRSLFRDSEARAARLKLLIDVSRELAGADGDRLPEAVGNAAQRAALFAGYATGAVERGERSPDHADLVIPLAALAERGQPGMSIVFSQPMNPAAVSTQEDADALRLLVELIEARLIVDVQRRTEASLLARLERREKELEQVLSRVVRAQENERAAICADLHDGVAQQVAALHRRLELVHLDLLSDNARAADDVHDLIGVARKAVSDLRGVIAGLRPPSLDDLGVASALREEARHLEAAGHPVRISDGIGQRLPGWLETLLFRVGQEALNNVAKHAPGSAVALDLVTEPDRSAVVLTVEDAGGTAPVASADPGTPRFGLEMMRERLLAVAGSLEAGPTASGFRIRAVVPLAGL
ncbi:MAG: hypothetical protein K2X61_15150 [Caulobacteraceae bacterium]|nr:hypothetical protein [Caulobacteraceae bacterium]